MNVTIMGAGRAGHAFQRALRDAGHDVALLHHDEVELVRASDLVLLSVPDDAIRQVADSLEHDESRVVAHVAGSRGLDVLGAHPRVGLLHPLATLNDPATAAARLRGATYSVAGDPLVRRVVASLAGRPLELRDDQRAAYHATAAVVANHLVALFGHAQRLAVSAGLSLEDYLGLARMALEDVVAHGPATALTGPAARGDMGTIDAHLAAIPESERAAYVTLANVAFELAEERRAGQLA